MGLNKFSFALKKGFNELNQVAKIMGDPEKTMSAQIVYFSLVDSAIFFEKVEFYTGLFF